MAKIIFLLSSLVFSQSILQKIVLFQGDSVAVMRIEFDSIIPPQRSRIIEETKVFQMQFRDCRWAGAFVLPENMKQGEDDCHFELLMEKVTPYTIHSVGSSLEVRFPEDGVLAPTPWVWYTGIGSAIVGGAALIWWLGSDSPKKQDKGIPDPNISLPD